MQLIDLKAWLCRNSQLLNNHFGLPIPRQQMFAAINDRRSTNTSRSWINPLVQSELNAEAKEQASKSSLDLMTKFWIVGKRRLGCDQPSAFCDCYLPVFVTPGGFLALHISRGPCVFIVG